MRMHPLAAQAVTYKRHRLRCSALPALPTPCTFSSLACGHLHVGSVVPVQAPFPSIMLHTSLSTCRLHGHRTRGCCHPCTR